MNVGLRSFVLAAGLVAFVTLPVAAQRRVGGAVEAPYNPRTEVTLRGIVHEVKQMKDVQTVTHLGLRTADHAPIEVHLGPSAWVAGQSVTFEVGDELEVIGSRVKYGGSDVMVARQIRKGNEVLILRDTQGRSRWSQGDGPGR